MPSKSAEQARLMRAVAHGWKKPGGGGPSKAVAQEFVAADKKKGVHMSEGGRADAKSAKVSKSAPKDRGAKAQDMRETDTHFHVGSFKIAKKGLNPKTLEGLRKHFACGGKVKKMAEGDIVPGAEDPSFTGTVPAALTPLADPAATLAAGAEEQARLSAFQPPAVTATPMDDFAAQAAAVPQPPPAAVPPGMSPDVRPDLTSQPPAPATAPAVPQGYAPPGDAVTAQLGSPESLDKEVQRKVAREGVPEALEWDYYHNLPKLHAALATEEKTASALIAKAHEDQATGTKRAAQSVEAQIAGMDKMFAEMSDDIKNSRINPNKFWESKNTGQLIMGAVGLILGGAGAGMTGGRNLAADIIEKAIDRDVEAQKANLGKKFNLLSFALQKTNNLVQAEQVTAALLGSAALADVQGRLARLKGDTAGVEHELAVQALRSQIAARIDSYRTHAVQNALAKTQLVSAIQTVNALNQLYRGDLSGPVILALPKEQQDRIAMVPSHEPLWVDPRDPSKGQVVDQETGLPKYATVPRPVVAGDKTRADKLVGDYTAIHTAKSALWELKQFAQAHILGTPFNPGRKEQAQVRLKLAIAALTPALYGADEKLYNNLTKASEGMIKDPSKVWGQAWNETQTSIDEILVHLSNKQAALDGTLYSKPPRRWY